MEIYNRWKKIISNAKKIERENNLLKNNLSILIKDKFPNMVNPNFASISINNHEFNVYSQNGEDGILLHILSKIGIYNYSMIEFGGSDGIQCNSANLLLNFGWKALLIEGSSDKVKKGKNYYQNKGVNSDQLTFVNSFITKENINSLFKENNFIGEIDVLSVDIDGNDYHVWEAIDVVNPRIVVAEYNAAFGPEKKITIPYKSNFTLKSIEKTGYYFGVSLAALEVLGNRKGYSLIGTDSLGVNAFFIRNDLMNHEFKKLTSSECYHENLKCKSVGGHQSAFEKIKHLELIEIK